MDRAMLVRFINESNKIEGITRAPKILAAEVDALEKFVALDSVSLESVEQLVRVLQPDAQLRVRPNQNVRVGRYLAPMGGEALVRETAQLLAEISLRTTNAWAAHIRYENLHPFTDGNGRSGRAVWLWQMREAPLGFLHTFYYQTLQHSRSA